MEIRELDEHELTHQKLYAEISKLIAETSKINAEIKYYPVVAAAGIFGGAFAAAFAVLKLVHG